MLIGQFQFTRSVSGFSLIELMISVLIGLIVAAGALTLIIAINQSNSDTVNSTRLTQELRAIAGVIADDVKRTRRIPDPIGAVAQGTTNSCLTQTPAQPCYPITPLAGNSGSCLTYGYSHTETNPASSSTTPPTYGLADYRYRSVRRVSTNGVGSVVLDELKFNPNTRTFDGLAGNAIGTDLPASADITSCPVTGAQNSYTLTSSQIDITALNFTNVNDSEIDLTVTGKLVFQDAYSKSVGAITRTFTQPIFIRPDPVQ